MFETTLEFLSEHIDMTSFDEIQHPESDTDLVFYSKTHDGNELHEIHTIYIVGHDSNEITKPYTIYHYQKEYRWSWHSSLQQEYCELVSTTTKHTMSEVLYYLEELQVIPKYYTIPLADKNPTIIFDTDNCSKLQYVINIAWSDDIGDYTTLFNYDLEVASFDTNNFDTIHQKLVKYCTDKIHILSDTPSYIINKMYREATGPFHVPINTINDRYCYWMREPSDDQPDDQLDDEKNSVSTTEVDTTQEKPTPDLPQTADGALLLARPLSAADPAAPVEVWGSVCEKAIVDDNSSEYYTKSKGKKYHLHDIRLDVHHYNQDGEQIHNDLVYIKHIPDDYETFYVYTNKFNMCKKVWNYYPDESFETESYDSYWSMYENHLYDKHELQSYERAQVYSLITSYINVVNDTTNITDKSSTIKDKLNLEILDTDKKNGTSNSVWTAMGVPCSIS